MINNNFIQCLPEQLIPQRLFVVFSENIKSKLVNTLDKLGQTPQVKKKLFDSIPYLKYQNIGLLGPLIGSPALALALESFLISGLKEVVLTGYIGAINLNKNNFKIGEIILPSKALVDEGVVSRYTNQNTEIQSIKCDNLELQNKIKENFRKNNFSFREAILCSTDTPNLETLKRLEMWVKNGAQVVDMEYAATCVLTNKYQAKLAACFIVSDLLSTIRSTGFNSKQVRETLEKIIPQLVEAN